MRYIIFSICLAVIALPVATAPVEAAAIKKACMASDRKANPRLCACIQSAADRTLTRKDQRLAASFFRDPDRAQEVRQSDRRSDEVFWKRYRTFGETAEAYFAKQFRGPVKHTIEIPGVIGVRHLFTRTTGCVIHHQPDRRGIPDRTQGLDCPRIGSIHRQDQIELCKVIGRELPRP